MTYIIWIPLLILYNFIYAYLSVKVQLNKVPIWAFCLFGTIQLWPFVSKYSSNLFFDGILYDIIILLSFSISMAFLINTTIKITIINWIGLILIIAGIILLKLK